LPALDEGMTKPVDEPADPFVTDAPEVVMALDEGRLLWENLKSIGGIRPFFNALEALEAADLRKVVLAARTESVKRP
jgi:hypothetical protein